VKVVVADIPAFFDGNGPTFDRFASSLNKHNVTETLSIHQPRTALLDSNAVSLTLPVH